MICTKDEAGLTPPRLYHNLFTPLVDFQAALNTEVVPMRGPVAQVDADGFLFVSSAYSASIPFESTVFEYEESSRKELIRQDELQRIFDILRLRLPIAMDEEPQPAATALASIFLNVT